MPPSWTAEKVVDDALARELICEQFPDIEAIDVQLLGIGWDNTAYLVDGKFVFRFPRRSVAVPLILIETTALTMLAPSLPLTVPSPRWLGVASEKFDWPFAGYEFISGQTACVANLSQDERGDCAMPLGQFLRALHAHSADQGRSAGLEEDKLGKLDFRLRLPQIREFLDRDASSYDLNIPALRALVDRIESAAPEPSKSSVVHGDFYVRHLVVNAQRQLHAVIDWGDAAIDDPAVDLCIVYSFLPPASRRNFCAAYGEIDERTELLARMRALSSGTILAKYGQSTGESVLLREGLYTLRCVVSEL